MAQDNTDTGKEIKALTSTTLSDISSHNAMLQAAAQATGLTALQIAAPIAREINKGFPGIEWVILGGHSDGKACG